LPEEKICSSDNIYNISIKNPKGENSIKYTNLIYEIY